MGHGGFYTGSRLGFMGMGRRGISGTLYVQVFILFSFYNLDPGTASAFIGRLSTLTLEI